MNPYQLTDYLRNRHKEPDPMTTNLTCDMDKACTHSVTHIDNKGYIYCTDHGIARRDWKPCRTLRDWELRRLQAGRPLTRY